MDAETRHRIMMSLSTYDYTIQQYARAKKLERTVKLKLREEVHRFDTAECSYIEAIDNCKRVIANAYRVPFDKVTDENTDGNEIRFTIKEHAGIVFYEYSERLGREDEY